MYKEFIKYRFISLFLKVSPKEGGVGTPLSAPQKRSWV